jgi:hypothetical protein
VPFGGLNRRRMVADSRVEQSPEGGAVFRGPSRYSELQVFGFTYVFLRACFSVVEVYRASANRHEGRGVGDGVRLRGRRKALKGPNPMSGCGLK